MPLGQKLVVHRSVTMGYYWLSVVLSDAHIAFSIATSGRS